MSFQSRELVEVGPIKKMADFIGRPLQAKQQVVPYRSHISIPGICPTFPVFFFFFYLVYCCIKWTGCVNHGTLSRFSKHNATSKENATARGIVWTRLPVHLLTSSGQGRVTFTTALWSLRNEDDDGYEDFI